MAEAKKIGRPSKGERKRVPVEVPVELLAAIDRRRAGLGLNRIDYFNLLAAADTGHTYGTQEGFALDLTA